MKCKKLISVLLIVAMLFTTVTIIFAGTVTAAAATTTSVATTEIGDVAAKVINSITESGFIKTLIDIFKAVWNYIQNNGGFGSILDSFYALIQSIGVDIDGIYEWLTTSGIIEEIAKIIF